MSLNVQEDVDKHLDSGGENRLDINELSDLLCELDAVATQVWNQIEVFNHDMSYTQSREF